MTRAQITITRGDAEVLVNVTGRYIHGTPHEHGEVDDISAEGPQGGVIYLDEFEEYEARVLLLETARQERESRLVDAQIDRRQEGDE